MGFGKNASSHRPVFETVNTFLRIVFHLFPFGSRWESTGVIRAVNHRSGHLRSKELRHNCGQAGSHRKGSFFRLREQKTTHDIFPMAGRRAHGSFVQTMRVRVAFLLERLSRWRFLRPFLLLFVIFVVFYSFSGSAPETAPLHALGCTPLLFTPRPVKHEFCVITRVKNSAEWIPEWIEYHRILGASRFFIADDCSDDNDETVRVLNYYQKLGFVQYYTNVSVHPCNIPDRQPHEELLINHTFHEAKQAQCDWVAMIDIDEYIALLDGVEAQGGIQHLFRSSMLPYLKLGWWTIGSDGYESKPPLLTSEAYRKGIFEAYHSKTIARASIVKDWAISLWPTEVEPHAACLKADVQRWQTDDRETRNITFDGKTDKIPVAPIILKHYVYRSWEEYMRSRGAKPKTSNSDANPWYNNIDRWLKGNFTTFELAPEFTAEMARQVRAALRSRRLPPIKHLSPKAWAEIET